ncbi:MAG: hypothetical protein ACYDBT_05995 [Desulfobulbaceae bacterium]
MFILALDQDIFLMQLYAGMKIKSKFHRPNFEAPLNGHVFWPASSSSGEKLPCAHTDQQDTILYSMKMNTQNNDSFSIIAGHRRTSESSADKTHPCGTFHTRVHHFSASPCGKDEKKEQGKH